jgi:hypothetical protein
MMAAFRNAIRIKRFFNPSQPGVIIHDIRTVYFVLGIAENMAGDTEVPLDSDLIGFTHKIHEPCPVGCVRDIPDQKLAMTVMAVFDSLCKRWHSIVKDELFLDHFLLKLAGLHNIIRH